MSGRREDKPAGLLSVWCEDASHAKPVLVTQFYPAHGGWQQWRSRAATDTSQTALVGDEPFDRDRHRGSAVRYTQTLRCRKYGQCRQSVEARQEKLFAALAALAAGNVDNPSMVVLAASIASITT